MNCIKLTHFLIAIVATVALAPQAWATLTGGEPIFCEEKDPSVELDPWLYIERDYNGKDDQVDLCMRFFCNKEGKVDVERRFWSDICLAPRTPEEWAQYHRDAEIRASSPTPRPIWTPPPRHPETTTAAQTPSSSTTTNIRPSTRLTSQSSRSAPVSSSTSTTSSSTTTTTSTTARPPSSSRSTTSKPTVSSTTAKSRKSTSTARPSSTTAEPEVEDSEPEVRTRRPRPYRGDEPPPTDEELDYDSIAPINKNHVSTTTEAVYYEFYDENDPTWHDFPKRSELPEEETDTAHTASTTVSTTTTTSTREPSTTSRPYTRAPSRITTSTRASTTTKKQRTKLTTSTTTTEPPTTTTETPTTTEATTTTISTAGIYRSIEPKLVVSNIPRRGSYELPPLTSNHVLDDDAELKVQASLQEPATNLSAYFNYTNYPFNFVVFVALVFITVYIICSVVYCITRKFVLEFEADHKGGNSKSLAPSPPSRELRTRFYLPEV